MQRHNERLIPHLFKFLMPERIVSGKTKPLQINSEIHNIYDGTTTVKLRYSGWRILYDFAWA